MSDNFFDTSKVLKMNSDLVELNLKDSNSKDALYETSTDLGKEKTIKMKK